MESNSPSRFGSLTPFQICPLLLVHHWIPTAPFDSAHSHPFRKQKKGFFSGAKIKVGKKLGFGSIGKKQKEEDKMIWLHDLAPRCIRFVKSTSA